MRKPLKEGIGVKAAPKTSWKQGDIRDNSNKHGFFSKFLFSNQWWASQETCNITWQPIFRTCPKNKIFHWLSLRLGIKMCETWPKVAPFLMIFLFQKTGILKNKNSHFSKKNWQQCETSHQKKNMLIITRITLNLNIFVQECGIYEFCHL